MESKSMNLASQTKCDDPIQEVKEVVEIKLEILKLSQLIVEGASLKDQIDLINKILKK